MPCRRPTRIAGASSQLPEPDRSIGASRNSGGARSSMADSRLRAYLEIPTSGYHVARRTSNRTSLSGICLTGGRPVTRSLRSRARLAQSEIGKALRDRRGALVFPVLADRVRSRLFAQPPKEVLVLVQLYERSLDGRGVIGRAERARDPVDDDLGNRAVVVADHGSRRGHRL